MGVFNGNPGQSAKLNTRQSVFAAKLPNLMSAKCITPTVFDYNAFYRHLFTNRLHGKADVCVIFFKCIIIIVFILKTVDRH